MAAQAKPNRLPPQMVAFFEQLPGVGTPEEAVPRVRTMLDAGFHYVIFVVFPFDSETLCLLAERVLPAVVTRASDHPATKKRQDPNPTHKYPDGIPPLGHDTVLPVDHAEGDGRQLCTNRRNAMNETNGRRHATSVRRDHDARKCRRH